jgi:hypothetical protein
MIQLETKNQLVQLGKRDEEINVEVVNDIDLNILLYMLMIFLKQHNEQHSNSIMEFGGHRFQELHDS